MIPEYYSIAQLADILSVSKETLKRWDSSGYLKIQKHPSTNCLVYHKSQLSQFDEIKNLIHSNWEEESRIKPTRDYKLIELFAGAGGLALGLEKSGFKTTLLNELDSNACKTLRKNRPQWNIIEGDVAQIDFNKFRDKIDVVTGGFPCQAFSYAGNKLGFEDTRGTLFFEFARVIRETNPKIFLGENVRGLLEHDEGRTMSVIRGVIDELGYHLVEPRVLKAIFYKVPQKRERLFLIGIRKDLSAHAIDFEWPSPFHKIMTVRDALQAGELFPSDVPHSAGQKYPTHKKSVLSLVPEGGYWRDLPTKVQKRYMQKSFFQGGGKTGMARRLAWDEPSLTLTCSPAQKQTERCHPSETRPLTVREYARIQTFPDDWIFEGSISSQYKQIGNAVPVNLALAIGRALIRLLNKLETSRSK